MPSHSRADLSVSALLRNLNDELDRRKVQKVDELLHSKAEGSARCRLGPRANVQDVQISRERAGGELCGVIFLCNRRTWKECLRQCLFGLPIRKKSLVEQVVPGMKLFLFEFERRQLWGVFEAISYGGMDIIPDAYTGGSFPCQVRVKVPEDCVALYEKEFYNALKDNYVSAGKFRTGLTRKQVCHLTSLFERKYLRAKGTEPGLIEYKGRRCSEERYNPTEPLLLTNNKACVYSEELDVTSLPHNLDAPGCKIVQDSSFLVSEEGVGFMYKTFTRKIDHRTIKTCPLTPFSNTIVQGKSRHLNVDVTRFTKIGGDLGTGDLVPLHSALTKQETIETVVIPGHVSGLHSDKPVGKSVWARISGCAKPDMAADAFPKQGKSQLSSLHPPLASRLPAEKVVVEINSSLMQEDSKAEVTADTTEVSLVGFKRRSVTSNNASENVNEAQASKRRRKLTRPFFEASADEQLVENAACQPMKIDLNIPLESQEGNVNFDRQNDSQKDFHVGEKEEQEPCILAQGDVDKKSEHLKDEEQEPCALALTLCSKATQQLLPPAEKEIKVTSNKQSSDLLLDISSELTNLELMSASSSRASTLCFAPCTPAKETVGRLGPVESPADEGPRLTEIFQDSTDARLADLEIQQDKMAISKDDFDNLVMAENCNEAVSENCNEAIVLSSSTGVSSKLSTTTISLDCTSGSALLNSIDIKSILSGLQVSGMKLQLGSSPCLILQLGDSSSSVGNQDQEREIQSSQGGSVKGHSAGEIVLPRPSSS